MQISLQNVGKKFQREWVFKNVNFQFSQGNSYAITGPNGSGKSTLLQVISGLLPPTEGHISYSQKPGMLELSEIYRYIDIAAPYQELIEELTLTEFLAFHFNFKEIKPGLTYKDLIAMMMLEHSKGKYIKHFSSGMKQRLKLALAFFSQSPVMLLDEPTSNLDEVGVKWYIQNITENLSEKLVIICSNQPSEYTFCDYHLNIVDFK